MDDDAVQTALATVCAYVQRECRDGVLVQLTGMQPCALKPPAPCGPPGCEGTPYNMQADSLVALVALQLVAL